MVRVHHAPGTSGSFTDPEYGTFDLDNGIIEVDDAAVAAELVAKYRRLSWTDDVEDNPELYEALADEPGPEPETCTAIVERTGEACGRPLPCPYHSD